MMEGPPGADSEEKHEPASDIDTVAVHSLKALDPEWPIREADIGQVAVTNHDFKSACPSRSGELFRVRNDAPNGGEQRLELNWFDIELVAPHGNGLIALAVQRIRGHADDRDVAGLRILLERPHRFPAVNDRHFEVHQNYVRVLGRRTSKEMRRSCQSAAMEPN